MNPWVITSQIYSDCILALNVNIHNRKPHESRDYTRASYNQPMVLLFPDSTQAEQFKLKHADTIRNHGIVMKNREVSQLVKNQVATRIEMVLIEMPMSIEEQPPINILGTTPLTEVGDESMLFLTIVAYALFYYIESFNMNENDNLTLNGILVNPSLELNEDDFNKHAIILEYLNKMYST